MLKFIEEKEYLETIRELNEEQNISTGFKPEITHRKNSVDSFFIKMMSEDWKDTLQGIISAELFTTKKGYFLSIDTLFVTPDNRGNKYGEILIFNLLKHIKEKYNDVSITVIANANVDCLKCFKNNNFDVGDENRKIIKVSKIL